MRVERGEGEGEGEGEGPVDYTYTIRRLQKNILKTFSYNISKNVPHLEEITFGRIR